MVCSLFFIGNIILNTFPKPLMHMLHNNRTFPFPMFKEPRHPTRIRLTAYPIMGDQNCVKPRGRSLPDKCTLLKCVVHFGIGRARAIIMRGDEEADGWWCLVLCQVQPYKMRMTEPPLNYIVTIRFICDGTLNTRCLREKRETQLKNRRRRCYNPTWKLTFAYKFDYKTTDDLKQINSLRANLLILPKV